MRARLIGAIALGAFSIVPADAHAQSAEGIRVHLAGADNATLQRADRDGWIDVCAAPCDVKVNASDAYRVDGKGIQSSPSFSLHASEGGSETVVVDAAPSAGQVEGFVLFGLGVLVGVGGAFITWIGASAQACDSPSSATSYGGHCELSAPELIPFGIATVAAAVVSATAGIVVIANTRVSTIEQNASTSKLRVRWFAGDASPMRAHEGSRELAPVPRSATTVAPIVTVSF